MAYSRQDRKDKGRVPISSKLVANLITTSGIDRVIAVDLHAAQIQGFFDIPVDHLSATPIFLDYINDNISDFPDPCFLSPDVGNVKVAESFANLLSCDIAIINKRRLSGTSIICDKRIIGSVKDKTVIMFDDMITTGNTMLEAATIAMENGARSVVAAATHGVFADNAAYRLGKSPISKIIFTNTISYADIYKPWKTENKSGKFVELCISGLLSEAIYRVHKNLSVSELFRKTAGCKR